tara:strand:+ start:564 stop:1424 length:861 start_codon:yes stop_codon:yes gene_type:complete
MKRLYLILILFGLSLNQDRSVIFNTGLPNSLSKGYTISSEQSVAIRFSTTNDYVLEAIGFYMNLVSEQGNLVLRITEDNNGLPGNIVSGSASWHYSLQANNELDLGYNLIMTTNLCIYLDKESFYWLTIESTDDNTEVIWPYSNDDTFTYAYTTLNDNWGWGWTSDIGYAGASVIFGEQIINQPYDLGDVNFDFLVNVIDVVTIVSHIMETDILDNEALIYADTNNDNIINVVDLVTMISIIVQEKNSNPAFTLQDINPASEYYNQNIGSSYFNGQVSCYYFGKQG